MVNLRRNVFITLGLHVFHESARAEIIRLQDDLAPGHWELKARHVFFVYSHVDSHNAFSKSAEATLDLSGLVARSTNNTAVGLELSFVRFQDFIHMPMDFCCSAADVTSGRCREAGQIHFHATQQARADIEPNVYKRNFHSNSSSERPVAAEDYMYKIRESGVYVLALSNCGTAPLLGVAVTGDVILRNPYGFLPGIDYYKLPLFGWLSLVYLVLVLVWMAFCIKFRKELFNIQVCIGVVIGFGLLETGAWYVFYRLWNASGVLNKFVFIVATLLSVIKCIFSYMLMLVGSMGWGITRPTLDQAVVWKIKSVCAVYITLDFIRAVVLAFRHGQQLPVAFVFLCLIPISVLNGIIFFWVFGSLSKSIQALQPEKQGEKIKLFQKLWRVLVASIGLATLGQLCEIVTLSRSIDAAWKTQWIYADGVSHAIFLLVLSAMMVLWRPHAETQRYAYSAQIDDQESSMPGDTIGVPAIIVHDDPFANNNDEPSSEELEPTAMGVFA